MKQLLLTGAFKYTKSQLDLLKSIGYDIVFFQDEREAIDFDVSNIEVVVCNSLFMYNSIEKFNSLKLIQLTSSGTERVPLNYVENNNIQLFNAKDVYSIPMAEWVILKILEFYKNSKAFYEQQNQQLWLKQRNLMELNDKTAVILGYGSVGSAVAKRLDGFGVCTIAVSRNLHSSKYLSESYLMTDISKVIKNADIIIITLPLNEQTEYLIDSKMLSVMKDDAILINVSRGKIINELDLIESLKNNKFLGVSLDVFEEEPLSKSSSFWNFNNVSITPHNSFVSDKNTKRLFSVINRNLSNYLNGE